MLSNPACCRRSGESCKKPPHFWMKTDAHRSGLIWAVRCEGIRSELDRPLDSKTTRDRLEEETSQPHHHLILRRLQLTALLRIDDIQVLVFCSDGERVRCLERLAEEEVIRTSSVP